ncbi:MAG: DNA polymerase IV [Eubacteriales bacterium]|nr:DNA polymerase IV [Eubacteriales bacterium]
MRAILHADCNGFFASVECLDHPAYWKVPLAVAGDPKSRSGIILAKNELAKKYDVKTAETIYQALRKCPGLVLVPPRMGRYQEISRLVNQIYLQYTDQVEPFSIDESFLDVTGSLRYFHATPRELADRIRERVRREIGITISVGVSFNKTFAKLGSDMKKPDATTVITPDNFRTRVWSLPIGDMLYVGRSAAALLEKRYLYTIGDFARGRREDAVRLLGKSGDALWRNANGLDTEPVRTFGDCDPLKSVGNGMTFRRNLLTEQEIRQAVIALSDDVASRLRASGQLCRTLQVMIRDPMMKTISRQAPLPAPTHLHRELADAAMGILRASWSIRPDGRCAPIRALTVTGQQLVFDGAASRQLSLFDFSAEGARAEELRQRLEKLEAAMADIRRQYGASSISMGCVENRELGIRQFGRHGEESATHAISGAFVP